MATEVIPVGGAQDLFFIRLISISETLIERHFWGNGHWLLAVVSLVMAILLCKFVP